MAKITPVTNGLDGASARSNINEALKSVDVDSSLSGDGTSGNPLTVVSAPSSAVISSGASAAGSNSIATPSTPFYLHRKTAITGGGDTDTLPDTSGVSSNQIFIIKDDSGTAGTNNLTIATFGAEQIDGQPSVILASDYAVVTLLWNGTSYNII